MRLNRSHLTLIALIVVSLALVRWHRRPGAALESPPTASQRGADLVAGTPLLSSTVPVQAATRGSAIYPVVDAAAGAVSHPDARFPLRLRNTDAGLAELVHRQTAILLRHALLDTATGEPLAVPAHLRSGAEPGSYIVQARGEIGRALRRAIRAAGGEVISYIPNNALLVRLSSEAATALSVEASVQAVLAFEPYFKFDAELLPYAVRQEPAPAGTRAVVTVSGDSNAQSEVERIAGPALERSHSPFGTLLTVELPPDALGALAALPGVSGIEAYRPRVLANDLTGYAVGSSDDIENKTPFLDLTGKSVVIGLNDSGVDFNHPAIKSSLLPVPADIEALLANGDNGHGTHVAGILAGNGSGRIKKQPQNSPTNSGFRGRAPEAKLFAQPVDLDLGSSRSDEYLQTNAAANGVHISNNSWAYRGNIEYNSASASYDAAVRDSLPGVPRAQSVIYVFAAGNEGFGDDIGTGGLEDSISAPANAKNVITVGALESLRSLTNAVVTDTNGVIIAKDQIKTNAEPGTYTTNVVYLEKTDSAAQVAAYSSRGNVGVGVEGEFGRFKPDVVAPGSFIVSARAKEWRLTNSIAPGSLEYEALYEMEDQLAGDPNGAVGDAYRFETGTSMAAPAISGLLAQMQEFFEATAHTNRPSPALARALLVNGARPTSDAYAVNPHDVVNYAGWGKAYIPNSLPRTWGTNFNQPPAPLLFVEESYTNALATGKSRSWRLRLNKANTNLTLATLRATLVWTDPPGNPAASIKLVNDLDLIITSKTTNGTFTRFWYGNDYVPNLNVNRARQRSDAPPADGEAPPAFGEDPTRLDRVNNVENVTLNELDDEYVISVVARRVNVQSLGVDHPGQTGTEETLQDWTLVLSVDAPNPIGLIDSFEPSTAASDLLPTFVPSVDILTNGLPRLRERVGANSPRIGGADGTIPQWHFYTFTNYNGATNVNGLVYGSNVAFVVFGTPNLGVPRNEEADADLYVSLDRGLTNLSSASLAAATRSVGRGGTEYVVFTNAPNTNEIYYIGVKSEDQQGAEYNIVGISSDQPFSRRDPDGRIRLHGIPVLQPIDDGNPRQPGRGIYMALGTTPGELRSILVEQTWSHEQFSDVLGNLQHSKDFAVLNNRNDFGGLRTGSNVFRVYDDSFSGGVVPVFGKYVPGYAGIEQFETNAYPVDGPGSLNNFLGTRIDGVWMFSSYDNAAGFVGRVNQLDVRVLENDLLDGRFHHRRVLAGRAELEVMNVPADVSLMRVIVTNITPSLPLKVYIRRDFVPDLVDPANNDKSADFLPPGGELTLGVRDVPPLVAGRYYIAVYNPNAVPVEYDIAIILERNLDARFTRIVTGGASLTNQDLSLGSVLTNLDDGRIVTGVKVGVRIDQPQVSDLKVHIANSAGRALLAENRGLQGATQYGTDLVTSNYQHVAMTYDSASALLRLFHNGRKVAERSVSGLTLPTNSSLHFGRDASLRIANSHVPVTVDDFGLWRRAISDDEVRRIFEEGAFGRGKNLSDLGRLLIGHWRFDGNGDESINGFDAAMVGPRATVLGQVGLGVELNGVGTTGVGDAIVGSATVRQLRLDARGRKGFTIEGWIRPHQGPAGVVVASFWDGQPANPGLPALLVGFGAPYGQGSGSLSAVFARTNSGSVVLSTGPGLITTEGIVTNTIYAQFTDSTNEAVVPIKFAPAPFTGLVPTSVGYFTNGFETVGGRYVAGQTFEDWLVVGNSVNVANDPFSAAVGQNYLQVGNGQVRRSFATVPGLTYEVTFASARSTGEPSTPQVEMYVDGVLDRVIEGTSRWRTNYLSLRAFKETTEIEFRSILPAASSTDATPGLGIDNFQVKKAAGTFSYLPEEPLLPVLGRPGQGDWRIELTDDRGGIPDAILRSWQITFTYAPTNTPADRLTNNVPYDTCAVGKPLTNSSIHYFYVDVPLEAQAATNILERISGNSPIDLLYSSSGLPDGNQDDDLVLLEGVTGTAAAGITRSLPPLLPRGQRYYLAVRNSNAAGTETCFRLTVQFGVPITALTNCVPYASTNKNEGLMNFYSILIPEDALNLKVIVTNMNEDVNLVVRRAPNLPTQTLYDFASTNEGKLPETVLVTTGGTPVSLDPGLWYLGVYAASTNLAVRDLAYTIQACTANGEKIRLTNDVPYVRTNLFTDIQYFYFDVTNDLISLDIQVDPLQGNVDAVLGNGRLPDQATYDAVRNGGGISSENFLVLRDGVAPLQLKKGRWWLGVYAVDIPPVSYTVTASAVADDGSIVDLFDALPFDAGVHPAPSTNYFRFNVPDAPTTTAALLEIYGLTGDADLYARRGTLPRIGRPFISSTTAGNVREAIVLKPSTVPVGQLFGDWYLAVVLKEAPQLAYTARAALEVNGMLISGEPLIAVFRPPTLLDPTIGMSFHTIPGERYAVDISPTLDPADWSRLIEVVAVDVVTSFVLPGAPYADEANYYRVVQIPK